MLSGKVILCLYLFALNINFALGGIYTYHNTKIEDDALWGRIGMYKQGDIPGKSKSFVQFQVDFSRELNESSKAGKSSIYVLLFHSENKDKIGMIGEDRKRHICCTQEYFNKGLCTEIGEVYISEKTDTMQLSPINFMHDKGDSSNDINSVHFEQVTPIEKTGMYYVYLINCPGSDVGRAFINGEIEFKNPYGYLPGEMYAYLPFYGSFSFLYIILGIIWLILSLRYRTQILPLQNAIAGVIVLGMIETATLYFDNLGYNNSGKNFVGAMIMGVIFSTVKRTLSRWLVLVVSMGYGVVKPTLGSDRNRVIIISVLYFVFSGTLNIVDLVQRTQVFSVSIVILLVFPVALLDTAFYWWIFLSLLKTIQQLTARKQTIKLTMYKRFFAVLIASGIFSSIIIIVQLFISLAYDQDQQWRSIWVWTGFWHLLYFVILVAIAILWRPTSNNSRYAYAEMGQNEEDDISLQPVGEILTQRSKSKEDEENAKLISEVTLDPSTSFTIDDDEKDTPAKLD